MTEQLPTPPRLLVIDDDNDLRLFLHDLLMEEGYTVDICGTLDEALDLLDRHVYHLILTDLLIHSHTDPLRSAIVVGQYAHPTPVAALTGWSISAPEVARAGLARLISKPFDLTELLSTVTSLLGETFNAEQRRLAEALGRYCEAFNAHDFNACASLCIDDVRVFPSEQTASEYEGPLMGRAAFSAHLERYLRRNPDIRFDDYLIHPQPRGLALRCVKSWQAPETPGGRVTSAASMDFLFSGDRISQINIRMDGSRWHELIPEMAYIPGAHESQS